MLSLLAGIVAIVFLLILSAFFSSSEIAFVSVDRAVIADKARQGNRRAKKLQLLLKRPSDVVTAIVVGNNIVNIAASVIAGAVATVFFGDIGIGVAAFAMTAVVLVFSEITPKAFGMRNESYALRVSDALSWITRIFSPVVVLLNRIAGVLISLIRKREDGEPKVTEDQILAMLRLGEEQGTIEKDERELVKEVFELDETKAGEVYIPVSEAEFMQIDDTVEELVDRSMDTGFSRFPVYGRDTDDVRGMVHVKDALAVEDRSIPVSNIMRDILKIRPGMKVDDVLRRMQRTKTHMALLVSDSGETKGLISMEDVIEQIFGEISDEHDPEQPGEGGSVSQPD
jgi:putative hemolysin